MEIARHKRKFDRITNLFNHTGQTLRCFVSGKSHRYTPKLDTEFQVGVITATRHASSSDEISSRWTGWCSTTAATSNALQRECMAVIAKGGVSAAESAGWVPLLIL